MWRWNNPAKTIGVGMLMLAVAGCTISVQPWTKPAAPTQPHDAPPVNPYGPPNPYAPANFSGPVPKALPQGISANNEATSVLIQKFNDANDERNTLMNQVQSLRRQLKEREVNLAQYTEEMSESTKYTKRMREDLKQWQSEMEDLRDRVRKLEDYRAALKPFIEEILHELREKETPKTLRLQTPSTK